MAQNGTVVESLPGLLSDQTTRTILVICNVFVGCPVVVVGVVGNLVNILVFVRQGVSEAITISFLGLAVTDLGTVLTYFWCCLTLTPWFQDSDTPLIFSELWYLTAAYPTIVFFRLSCWITVFIAVERCLCIVQPMKVKQIISPRRTIFTILFFFLIAGLIYIVPVPFTTYITWRFDAHRNRSMLGIAFTDNTEVKVFEYYKEIVVLFVSFFTLSIVTFVLVIQIKRVSKWRQSVSVQTSQESGSISQKDKKVVRIACLIAVIFNICFMPDVILQMVYLSNTEFSITRRYENSVFVCWSLAFLCHGLSASINCFIYYCMSSRYRTDLLAILNRCRRQDPK